MLCSGFVKLFVDGVTDSGTAVFVDDYADQPGWKGEPLTEAPEADQVQARLDELLPVWVSGCVSVAAVRDGVLTIVTSSPAVATSVSQMTPRLAAEIRKNEAQVTSIKVVLQPGDARAPAAEGLPPLAPLSAQAQADLIRLAANVSDQRLKKALQSLGTRKNRPR
jgi:hypothetical protein